MELMVNLKISWGRVFFATQVLSVGLFAIVLFYFLPKWFESKRPPEVEITNAKTDVKLIPQTKLSNDDDCADIVVVSICNGNKCQYHVNSFHVLCAEQSSKR